MTIPVSARRLTKVFEEGNLVVVDDLSFTVSNGETVAITGPSGSGKSTLLNLIGLLDTPDSGSVHLFGQEVAASGGSGQATRFRGRHIGFVFQDSLIDRRRTAIENVLLGLRLARTDRRTRRNAALEAMDRVGLCAKVKASGSTLSGGERQRLAIARAIAHKPRLLLCDEPTGNLDPETSDLVWDALVSAVPEEGALILVTHDLDLAARCDRVGVLLRGQLDWSGRGKAG